MARAARRGSAGGGGLYPHAGYLRPGTARYNVSETRLIEPDVAFVKRDGEYVVMMNEEDMPTMRLSHAYRKMLRAAVDGEGCSGLREGALQVGDPTAAQHRAEEEHDPADVRGDRAAATGVPGTWRSRG